MISSHTCTNTITIHGPSDTIESLWNKAHEIGLLEALCPIGEWEYAEALTNWGTSNSYGMDDLIFTRLDNGQSIISGTFVSDLNPPTEALESFLKKNDDCDVVLEYYTTGKYQDFWGKWTPSKGLYDYGMKKHKEISNA